MNVQFCFILVNFEPATIQRGPHVGNAADTMDHAERAREKLCQSEPRLFLLNALRKSWVPQRFNTQSQLEVSRCVRRPQARIDSPANGAVRRVPQATPPVSASR